MLIAGIPNNKPISARKNGFEKALVIISFIASKGLLTTLDRVAYCPCLTFNSEHMSVSITQAIGLGTKRLVAIIIPSHSDKINVNEAISYHPSF
jgi:hypothetical protein